MDIWRKTNPSKKLYAHHNPEKIIHSRLDRIYITKTIKTKTSKIHSTSLSDHDSVSVILQISEENPGGQDICKQKKFQEIFKIFWKYWQNNKIEYENLNDWWDAGKLYLKTIATEYCTTRNKQINKNNKN